MMSKPRVLYAIQGTGNGHISRALEILPHLQKEAEVDVLISSRAHTLELPIAVKYRMGGLGFVFGKKGGIDYYQTWLEGKVSRLWKEIRQLPVRHYNLILNDFEPVSAWAARWAGIPCIGLSNQYASRQMASGIGLDPVGRFILQHYAPVSDGYGIHYESKGERIFTPIIRTSIREAHAHTGQHICTYLPSYAPEKIIKLLGAFRATPFEVFTKEVKREERHKNITLLPIQANRFEQSLLSSRGVFCNAGFGVTTEALFLGKPLLVVPMKGQIEQQINAKCLSGLGVTTLKRFKEKHLPILDAWLREGKSISVHYPDITRNVVQTILEKHAK
jgi:uncharacterized protein (TIGR00661 family)